MLVLAHWPSIVSKKNSLSDVVRAQARYALNVMGLDAILNWFEG